MLQNLRRTILILLLLPVLAYGQGVQPVKPIGSTLAPLFPNAFASADNIAAQTATFMHGGCMGWDGANWDRCLLTAGALNVSVQNATLAVTQSGTWNIGTVTTLTSITNPVAVTGTFWQATQPISGTVTANAGSGTFTVSGTTFDGILRDGTGDTTQANVTSGRLNVDGSGVTQPISAASLPLPTGAATSANQDGIIRDGTGDTTQANVTNGRLNVDGSGVTQPVSGTVTANQGGTWTVQPGNTANTTPWLTESPKTASASNDGACPSGAANTTAITSNASRRGLYMAASPANTDDIYIKLGATATSSDFRLAPGQPFNIIMGAIYTGQIDFLPVSGTQALCVAELQ